MTASTAGKIQETPWIAASLKPLPGVEVLADTPAVGLTADELEELHLALTEALDLSWSTVPLLPMIVGVELQEHLRAARDRVAMAAKALRLMEIKAAGWRMVDGYGMWVRWEPDLMMPGYYFFAEALRGNGFPAENTMRRVAAASVRANPELWKAVRNALVDGGEAAG